MEFTGERLVLGEVDKELETEHLDRYRFALQFAAGKTVLDAACGTGYGTSMLAQVAEKAVGIDISEEAVEYAQEHYSNGKTEFAAASIASLPFPEHCYDAVVSFETLEHVDQEVQRSFLREICRVLKPEGVLVISTPNREVYDNRGVNEFHVAEMTDREFRDFLGGKFEHIQYFTQKWEVCDTIIGEDEGTAKLTNGLALEKAEYLIAVCSQKDLPEIATQVSINEDGRLSKLTSWAVENDRRNTASNKHIAKLDSEIDGYQKELKNQLEQSQKLKERLEAQEQELINKSGHIEQLLESERTLSNRIAEQHTQIALQEQELHNKEGHIDLLLQSERVLADAVEKQTQVLLNKEGQIQQLLESERSLNRHSEDQEQELREKESRIQDQEQELREKESRIQDQEQELREKESRIQEQEQELFAKESHIEQLLASEQELSTGMTEQKQELNNKRGHIELLLESERSLNRQVAEQAQDINNKTGHIELLLQSERDLQAELNRIKGSRSWRLMSILWKIRAAIAPKGSKRSLLLGMLWLLLRHPLKFLHKCTPKRIANFFRSLRREGAGRTSAHLKQTVRGIPPEPIDIKPLEVMQIPEPEEDKDTEAYDTLAVPEWSDPDVSIVIPVYNQFDYTYLCVKSILENSGDVAYEIIIADDCSTDVTRKIDSVISGLHVIHNSENLRFLRNCNNAAKQARGKYILFLNNDTQVQKDWLAPLVELIERSGEIGMVGSKLVYPDGRLQEAGGILWKDGSAWNYGNGSDPELPEYNYVKEVDYISGAAIMIRRSLWEKIGGFDDRFAPAYCEDSDLAFEVRKHGYKVMYQPLSVVVHFEGVSNGTDLSSGQKAYQVENQKKFFAKWKDVLEAEHLPNGEAPFLTRERGIGKKLLLMVDHYVPQFDKDAGSRTVFQYLRLFTDEGYHVKFIGDNFYPHQPYTQILQQMGVEVLHGPWYANHWKEWLEENGRYFSYAFLNRPHISVKYIDAARELTPAKIVYYGHDLHFLRERREYELTGNVSLLKSSKEQKAKELSLMRKADVAYYTSYVEVEEIHREDPDINVKAIPAYLFSDNNDVTYQPEQRKNMMFVGGFSHGPNVDAVKWFASEIMPQLTCLLPDVVVYIIGSNPPKEILDLGTDRLKIVGFVSDEELAAYYSTCRLAVVPLRYGAGIKGKVVEAMHCGLPIITTKVGAEGISGAEKILCIADDSREFAAVTAKLYEDGPDLIRRSKAGVQYVAQVFSAENAKRVIGPDFDMF